MAKAEPSKPVRIIQITKENAERSAAAMAAAKSPHIGAPPPGKIVPVPSDWRNSRALSLDDESAPVSHENSITPPLATLRENASDRAVVQIIRPGKEGLVVESHVVPRHKVARGL